MPTAQDIALQPHAKALFLRHALSNAVVLTVLLIVLGCAGYLVDATLAPDSIENSLVSQLIVLIWLLCVFAACAWAALTSRRSIAPAVAPNAYVSEVGHVVERWLIAVGIVAAAVMCALALAAHLWPIPQWASGVPILGIWMFLAAVVPVECGATTPDTMKSMCMAMFAPWAFVFAFPMYMSERPGANRKATVLATASMVALMAGFVVFTVTTQ